MRKKIQNFSKKATRWIGSVQSIVVHTIFFVVMLSLRFFGVSSADVMLILTTAVSLEAIYLAIFIQMTVNEYGEELGEVSEDIDEIQKDMDEIQEDIEDIEEEDDKDEKMLNKIEDTLGKLIEEVIELKKFHSETQDKK